MADRRNFALEITTAIQNADLQALATIAIELVGLVQRDEERRAKDRARKRPPGNPGFPRNSTENVEPSPFSPTPPFSPPSSSPSSSREAEIARRLPSDQGRIALTALLATSGQKAAVLGEIEACLDGARGAQFKVTPAQMDMAISDYVANELSGGRFNAAHFRRHVQRAAQPQVANGRRGGVGQRSHDNALEALKDVG